ncbi:MAG: AAA family ATPase, partial [Deltaproteobacteria bacterium]|nr:AAA family ATPase [Deltaproteobacteria bacterium]
MTTATERKTKALLSLPIYRIEQADDPATATMRLGKNYTLLIDVRCPTEQWKVAFKDGQQALEFPVGDPRVPAVVRVSAEELIKDYSKALVDIAMDEGPLEEPQKDPAPVNDPTPTPEMKTLADSGFDLGKVQDTPKAPQAKAQPQTRPQAKAPAAPTKPPAKTPEAPAPRAPTSTGLLDLIHSYVGNDVLEVFGETGSGKSKFALTVAREAIASGKMVFYLDTERNLTEADVRDLKGCEYKYTPLIDEIDKIVQNLPKVDVVILDSIGFPVLTTFARMSVKQKGDALLKLIAIFGDLKGWAYKNNGIVVVTNQPESEFNKGPNHILRPFGDKSQFAAK